MSDKIIIFLESRIESRVKYAEIDILHYLICEENLDTYNSIHNVIKNKEYRIFKNYYNIATPLRIKILTEIELVIYQNVFGFTNREFSSIPELDILKELKEDILRNEIGLRIKKIFNFYKTIDIDFVDDIQDEYEKVIGKSKDIGKMVEYKIFLENWIDYTKYIKAQKDLIYPNSWDKNLNGIIDQYLNVNPYYCEKYNYIIHVYYFFETQNWLNLLEYTLDELENLNNGGDETYSGIIKYMKKMNYRTTYMNKF